MKLNTTENFLLLAQHPTKGKLMVSDMHIRYGIIGSLLLDMSLEGKIAIDNNRLILKNGKNSNDPIVSEIITIIRNSSKPRKIKYWINKLAWKSKKYKWMILHGLANKKLIRIENKKLLGFIPYKSCYLVDSQLRNEIIGELKKSILSKQELSQENVLVLGLLEACKMHKAIASDKNELKRIKRELKEIIKESPIASTVDKTITEVQAAVMAAIVSSMAATTATTSN